MRTFLCTNTLERYLADRDRPRALVLLEIYPDAEDANTFRLEFECTFQAHRFRHGGTRRVSYYAACEGGQLDVVVASPGTLIECSPPREIAAEYVVKSERTQKGSFAIKPTAELAAGHAASAKLSGLEVQYEAGSTYSRQTTLRGTERWLNVIQGKRSVRWDLAALRIEKVVQDFFCGKILLWATAQWPETAGAAPKRTGRAELVPDRIEFYDADRRPIGWLKSMLMWWTIRKHSQATLFRDGCEVEFEITDNE